MMNFSASVASTVVTYDVYGVILAAGSCLFLRSNVAFPSYFLGESFANTGRWRGLEDCSVFIVKKSWLLMDVCQCWVGGIVPGGLGG